MARVKTRYVCQECGHATPGWLGRCPECEAWGSMVEEVSGGPSGGAPRVAPARAVPLTAVSQERIARFPSGIDLLDRVLGGGVVPGSAVLLGGEPGIGKSTLLLAAAESLARAERRVLYVTAEESPRQLRLRAERLGCQADELLVAGETDTARILATVDELRPAVLVVDSIQAVRTAELAGIPGSIGQVRAAADVLVAKAKATDCTLFLVGHVTKEGSIAGPKSLEHLVDTVLSFEAEGHAEHRVLRAAKNRFGPTGEVGLFLMGDDGLRPVADPSRVLLSQRHPETPGSAVVASMHGTRPLLVEVQALVHPTSFPSARRMSLGLDGNRVSLLLAVLGRFAGLALADHDVFLNVVGGLALREPAVDLAVAAALLSARTEVGLPGDVAYFGEVGLLGEIRPVARVQARLRETAALGFRRVVGPRLDGIELPPGLRLVALDHVRELVSCVAAGE